MSCYNKMDIITMKYGNRRRFALFVRHDDDLPNSQVLVMYPKTMHIARVPLNWVKPLLDKGRYKLVKQGGQVSVVRRTRGRN